MVVSGFWKGRRVLLTGHTGFKGAWLSLWLERLGAAVTAVALEPDTAPSLHAMLTPFAGQRQHLTDIRDLAALERIVAEARPEIVFHLAAEALVRRSYSDPVGTFGTNVMGTVNLLQALRRAPEAKAVVIVTTDKVYENDESGRPFEEKDRLGGKDPYSASKACAELVAASFRASFFAEGGPAIATARAGNVVGGGDFSADRLVPDFVRAVERGEPIRLRSPMAVRPWQHVVEPLAGYLMLAEALALRPSEAPEAVNFGPDPAQFASVATVAEALGRAFERPLPWLPAGGVHPPEARQLRLSSRLAAERLGWRPLLSLDETLAWTAEWYRAQSSGAAMRQVTEAQIAAYEALRRPRRVEAA
ncbi:CDP-glucose 4,6-dehydratase [Jiella endophytica]|uniref:CDP-glucose 4,6-dehydratase n=1 Tax=Jiella endophytica TaxID=2558362 RepID=A0A4Y8RJL0_9HYPH|nr:CDP-glucose 4,6-dehydratase [Jiella endophytica]TFF22134.1 CDP-glucose 4,6-dehydratase [Jiella endophytica]